jgi:hypothetical protein
MGSAKAALPRLRRSLETLLPLKPASDPGSLILYSSFLLKYAHYEGPGDLPRVLRALRALQRNLPADHASQHGLTLIALFRWMGIPAQGEIYTRQCQRDPELNHWIAAAARGEVDGELLRRHAARLTAAMLEESRRHDPEFVHTVIRELSPGLPLELQGWALRQARETMERETPREAAGRREEIAASLKEVEAALDEEQETQRAERPELLARVFDAWLASVRTPSDLHTLEFALRTLPPLLRGDEDPERAARAQQAMALLRSKIRLRSLRRWHQAAR